MAEMPDVISGETIESEWGNDIRDRTIQRYLNAADRTALNASPTEGDLAYMLDSDSIYLFNGSIWIKLHTPIPTADIADDAITGDKLANNIMDSLMLVRSSVSEGPDSIPSSATVLAGVTTSIPIPASWGSWACQVTGHTVITQTGDSTSAPTSRLVFSVIIDGTSNEFHSSHVGKQPFGGAFGVTNSRLTVPLNGFRSGMTTTGSRTVGLERSRGGLDDVYVMANTVLIARAHRLT